MNLKLDSENRKGMFDFVFEIPQLNIKVNFLFVTLRSECILYSSFFFNFQKILAGATYLMLHKTIRSFCSNLFGQPNLSSLQNAQTLAYIELYLLTNFMMFTVNFQDSNLLF
jgi:hypothetical protein